MDREAPVAAVRRPALGPRFGIGALLLLTTAIALAMGVWSSVVRPYADQARAVSMLREWGAQIELGPAPPSEWRRATIAALVGPDAYVEATSLRLGPDVGLPQAASLPEGFASLLGSMRWLRLIELDRTDFDDAHAVGLAGLDRLEELSLRYTQITDAGVARLARAERLRVLRVTGCRVSLRGLSEVLDRSESLEVYARWTDVSPEEIGAYESDGRDRVHASPQRPAPGQAKDP